MRATAHAIDRGRTLLLRTSGSTGRPRLVARRPATWTRSFAAVAQLTGLTEQARVWVPGPVRASMNLFAAVLAHDVGARVQSQPEGATHAHLTPRALRQALDAAVPVRGLHLTVAGDRLTRAERDRAARAGAVVAHYYGSAELSFVAWGTHEHDLEPFPEVECRVRGGEIWVRSPYLCDGYVGDPGPLRTTPDGFATVGDLGVLDGPHLRVLGRAEDRVVTGAATVLVTDVEEVLRQAAQGEVVVVGLPHGDLGEVVTAALTDPEDLTAVREAALAQLHAQQRPRWWFAVPRVPTTGSGKTDRAALRRQLASGGARRLAPGAGGRA